MKSSDSSAPKVRCAFRRWAGGRGLLGCENKETADYLAGLIGGIQVDDQSFKAWTRGECRRLKRMTFYTPAEEGLSPDRVMQQIKDQNELPGSFVVYSHQDVASTMRKTGTARHGWHFHVGVSPDNGRKDQSNGEPTLSGLPQDSGLFSRDEITRIGGIPHSIRGPIPHLPVVQAQEGPL